MDELQIIGIVLCVMGALWFLQGKYKKLPGNKPITKAKVKKSENKVWNWIKGKRKPTRVILHCSATPDDNLKGSRWCELDIEEVEEWHLARGFKMVGYHKFIKRDGTIQNGRELGRKGAHTKRHNWAIGLCYAGRHKPTQPQENSIRILAEQFRKEFGISALDWHCHNEFSTKDCPGFSKEVLRNILATF